MTVPNSYRMEKGWGVFCWYNLVPKFMFLYVKCILNKNVKKLVLQMLQGVVTKMQVVKR